MGRIYLYSHYRSVPPGLIFHLFTQHRARPVCIYLIICVTISLLSILTRKSDGISIEVVKLYATLCRGDKILQICDVSTWEQHILFFAAKSVLELRQRRCRRRGQHLSKIYWYFTSEIYDCLAVQYPNCPQFQMEVRKIRRRRLRSSEYTVFDHFTFLFCRGW